MPAALRGGSRGKPRGKAPAGPKGPAGPAQPAAKLRAAKGSGLAPQHALFTAVAVVGLGVVVLLSTGDRSARLKQSVHAALDARTAALGFKLAKVSVQGASPMAAADIMRRLPAATGQSILGLDLKAIRAGVAESGWVKSAKVVRLLPDTLVVAVVERRPAAVWQHAGRMTVIDPTGYVIADADPALYADLPLVVGAGANEAAEAILPAVAQRPKLAGRMEALVRVDGRRWDVRLKDGGLVQLPAIDEGRALTELDTLDQRQQILDLGFSRIDLRDPAAVSVRPRETAAAPSAALVAGGA